MKWKYVMSLAVAFSLSVLGVTSAQVGEGREQGPDRLQQLNLTADQRAQLDALKESMRTLKEQYRARGEKPDRGEIKTQREVFGQTFEAILTPEQLAQLQESQEGRRGRGGFMGGPLRYVLRQLDLSEDQRRSLQELREAHRNDLEQYREAGEKPDFEATKVRHEALKQSFETILTPAQLTKLSELRSRREERGVPGRHRGRRMGGFRLKGLDLSEDQKAQLKTLWQGMAQEMKQARENGQRPSREDRIARRRSMREAVSGILTPEQHQQLEERRASRGGGEGKAGASDSAVVPGFGSGAETPATAVESKSWGQIKAEKK